MPNVKPVQKTHHRVPIPVKNVLRDKLCEIENEDIIAKVTEPKQWVSIMIAICKPNKLRLGIDPFNLNKAIGWIHYPILTVEEIPPRLTNAKIFTVVEIKDGYLRVELDQESSYLTTFWIPFRQYCWRRMPFRKLLASEEFQQLLDECLEGLENVEVIADDIIIYGTGITESKANKSNDRALWALLTRC